MDAAVQELEGGLSASVRDGLDKVGATTVVRVANLWLSGEERWEALRCEEADQKNAVI